MQKEVNVEYIKKQDQGFFFQESLFSGVMIIKNLDLLIIKVKLILKA